MIPMLSPVKIGSGGALATSFQWLHGTTFSGYVFDAADLRRKFVVEVLVDGLPFKCALATDYVQKLAESNVGDGLYGFSFALSSEVLDHAERVEARIANLDLAVGEPIGIRELSATGDKLSRAGAIRWLGGLRCSGWIGDEEQQVVEILVDDERVMEVRPSGWAHVGEVEDPKPAKAFDFHLPAHYADGAAHRVAALTAWGGHLEGSPLAFVAFADGSGQAHRGVVPNDTLHEAILDRLVPMSVPFTEYPHWRERAPTLGTLPRCAKVAVLAVGAGEMRDTLASLNVQDHGDWVAASLPVSNDFAGFDLDSAKAFLAGEGAEAEFVIFVLAGTILELNAIARISSAFDQHPGVVAVYADVDVAAADGSRWPLAFSAFDYERMLEQGYCSHFFALRRPFAERAFAKGAHTLYRVFNSLVDDEDPTANSIAHLPGSIAVLATLDIDAARKALTEATRAHLKQRGVDARLDPGQGWLLPAAKVSRALGKGTVTIVIPTRNRRDLIQACINSLQPTLRKRHCEILVVDNDSTSSDTLEYLASIDGRGAKVLRVTGNFNFAHLNNVAASAASGDFLCLLNNDVQALDGLWLEEMLGRIAAPDVGVVGAMLLWPSGVVQHGGVVLGANFAATHAFNDRLEEDAGYCDLLRVARQCSAVTAACLLTRRRDYLDVGGMDAFRFPVNFNDVDYCLKLRAAGKRIVFTPHARLRHLESASRGSDVLPHRKARADRELRNLRAKWADVLTSDPFYSPVLSLDPVPFSALAYPYRSLASRTLHRPKPVELPPGF